MSLTHLAVLSAVTPLHDEELERWTHRRDSYDLNEEADLSRALGLPGCHIWRLQPAGTITPVSIRLAERPGGLAVLTGQLQAVADLLLDAAPPDEALPELLCALWADPHPGTRPDPGGAVSRGPGWIELRLTARDRWRAQRWIATLRRDGASLDRADAPEPEELP